METARGDVTLMLQQLSAGNREILDKLIPVLYDELRRLAAYYLRQERGNHTLQATALVHEAYLRLVDQREVQWQNRNHFFGVAAQVMRRILLDYARKHEAVKRGGSALFVRARIGALSSAGGVAQRASSTWRNIWLNTRSSRRCARMTTSSVESRSVNGDGVPIGRTTWRSRRKRCTVWPSNRAVLGCERGARHTV